MDFTQFIDSRDIAEHLKKLDYKFTAPEAAYLVYQSGRATLEEKFTAWEYIIENFPDCSLYCPDEDLQTDVAFDGMAFSFPTPFERGDILTGWDHGEILVLDHLPTWDSRKCVEQGVPDRITERADRDLERLIKKGDINYMCVYGCAFVENGIHYDSFGVDNYLKYEYLREALKGKRRVLKPLSSFLKGDIEEELLCHAYHYILLEESLAEQRRFLSLDYLQETLDDAGITVAKDS